MNVLRDQHHTSAWGRPTSGAVHKPRASTACPQLVCKWSSMTGCDRQACNISAAAARTKNYPAVLARHWSAARDGSLILFWANWSQWPPGKTLSNLKFLAHLYDAHRLPPELLETIGDHVAAAVQANVTQWNRHQRSRALLLLSRLLLVPDAGLWVLLVSGLLSKDGQLTLPAAAQRAADIAHTAGQSGSGANSNDEVVLQRQKRKLKASRGATTTRQSTQKGRTITAQDRNKHREAMARVGLLYSVSVMHMLSSGSQAGSWGTLPFGCLEHHLLPDQVKMPSVTEWADVPEYLELPADTLESAVSSWRSVSKHAPEIDGVWLPINHEVETRRSSPLEKSVVHALQNELQVPIMQEAVLEGSYVAVDVAIVGKSKRKRKNAVFVAVEVQGPHHFVSRKAKERRSSRVKQLLRQHAGWHVVALSFKEWKKNTGSRRQLLREKLSVLPEHCWKVDDDDVA